MGRAVRRIREEWSPLTAAQVAARIDVPIRTYRAIEAGQRDLAWLDAIAMSELYDLELDELRRLLCGDPSSSRNQASTRARR